MVQQIKALATWSDDLRLIPRIHLGMTMGQNQDIQVIF